MFKKEPKIELNTICIIEIATACFILNEMNKRRGTNTIPPPTPKKPEMKPVRAPKRINSKIIF
jgi:hypothetical protein